MTLHGLSIVWRWWILIAFMACASQVLAAGPGTAFTYQGQLKQSGAAFNGVADLEFRLFTLASGGSQVGPTVSASAKTITGGVFTHDLDFGSGVFTGDERWLQVAVRIPAGSGAFTTLTPRQPLRPAPYALFALAGGGPWSLSGTTAYYNAGKVGIGTAAPAGRLQVETTTDDIGLWVQNDKSSPVVQSGVFGSSEDYGGFFVSTASIAQNSIGVYGLASNATGTNFGVLGRTLSPDGFAGYFDGPKTYVSGLLGVGVTAPLAPAHVVAPLNQYGQAILGVNTNSIGASDVAGIRGEVNMSASGGGSNRGVFGRVTVTSGSGLSSNYGVYGEGNGPFGRGVYGEAPATTGDTYGVHGISRSASGVGVLGESTSVTGFTYGVRGIVNSPQGYAGSFIGGRSYFSGNVGFGTNAPTVAVDVLGDIHYTGVIVDVSDERLKRDILPIPDALAKLGAIDGVTFSMIQTPRLREVGVIAQQVREVLPEAVRVVDREHGYLGVSYPSMVGLLVECVKQLKSESEEDSTNHAAAIDALRAENEELKDRLRRLEAAVERLSR